MKSDQALYHLPSNIYTVRWSTSKIHLDIPKIGDRQFQYWKDDLVYFRNVQYIAYYGEVVKNKWINGQMKIYATHNMSGSISKTSVTSTSSFIYFIKCKAKKKNKDKNIFFVWV